jgi:hypothetical protein
MRMAALVKADRVSEGDGGALSYMASSGMPGADGNEDTGYVHSVYRSGDRGALFYGHHCIHTIHALTLLF